MASDEPAKRDRAEPREKAEQHVAGRDREFAVLDQSLALEHPGGERGVRAERRGAGEQQSVATQPKADQQAQNRRSAHVDHERAQRKVAGETDSHHAVDKEAQQRAHPAEQADTDPDAEAHTTILALLTYRVAR